MTAPLLQVEGLSLEYAVPGGPMMVLQDVDLQVGAGEVVGLVGESGSGKSTFAFALLRHLASNARISGGRILFAGEDLVAASPARLAALRGRRIGMVFQDPSTALNPALRLGEQVAESLRHHRGLDRVAAQAAAEGLLGSMHLAQPKAIMRRFPHEVSGGEKQRVVMAMALAGDPALLVMDEPTTALDATTAAGILTLIRELQERRGLAVLYISHDLGNVARIAGRVAVIYAGRIVEEGPTQLVLSHPAHVYTRLLLASLPNPMRTSERRRLASFAGLPPDLRQHVQGCRFAPRCPLAEPECSNQALTLTQGSACRRAGEAATFDLNLPEMPVAARDMQTTLLRVEQVSVTYRHARRPAVSDVSLHIANGETLGLVGESGSGKSSLARALLSLVAFSWAGDFGWAADLGAAPAGTSGDPNGVPTSGAITQPDDAYWRKFVRPLRLYDGLSGAALDRAVAEWLGRVRLPAEYARRFPNELSGGEKQRVAIARAFAARPALVLCDEITTGLDASVQASVLHLLTNLQARDGHGAAADFP